MRKLGLPARKMDRHFTYRDYRSWPEDERWELIDGVAYNMCAAPNVNHQALVGSLHHQIVSCIAGTTGGPCKAFPAPTDVFFPAEPGMDEVDVDTVVQPDVLVVCDRSRIRLDGIWGAPDWIIEILSPWTQKKDLAEKFNLYERSGVREYWIADPGSRSLVVYVLAPGGRYGDGQVDDRPARIRCSIIEGLEIDMAEAFASMPA